MTAKDCAGDVCEGCGSFMPKPPPQNKVELSKAVRKILLEAVIDGCVDTDEPFDDLKYVRKIVSLLSPELNLIKLPRHAFKPDHKGYKNCIECEKATAQAQLQHDGGK